MKWLQSFCKYHIAWSWWITRSVVRWGSTEVKCSILSLIQCSNLKYETVDISLWEVWMSGTERLIRRTSTLRITHCTLQVDRGHVHHEISLTAIVCKECWRWSECLFFSLRKLWLTLTLTLYYSSKYETVDISLALRSVDVQNASLNEESKQTAHWGRGHHIKLYAQRAKSYYWLRIYPSCVCKMVKPIRILDNNIQSAS